MRHRIPHYLAGLVLAVALTGCQFMHDMENLKATPPAPAPKLATYHVPGSITHSDAALDDVGSRDLDGSVDAPSAPGKPGVGHNMKVGLLLPLTGRSAELGKAMQDAATLSLFDKYARLSGKQASIKVELIPKDTGDTPEQAAAAAKSAIADGAELLIGPIFADATDAAAIVARDKHVPMLSLSNSSKGGDGVYLFGFSPQEQAVRVVTFAMGQGKTRIAALVPDSPLGNAVMDGARTALSAKGLKLVKEVRYAPEGTGIGAAVSKLAPATGEQPVYDALLLPEGGAPLNTILRTLQARGVNSQNVQLLGTGIWDDKALLRRVPLESAWLASSPTSYTNAFEERFQSTYQYVPPRIASLAYDAVALAVTLATSGRPLDATTLTSKAGFEGPANGLFRLKPDGTVQRGLAVLQASGWGFKELDPAPPGFTGQ